MKIEVINTKYTTWVPNGSIMTVVLDFGDGDVMATLDGGDGFEWFMSNGTYRVVQDQPIQDTITIKPGKYYRTRDGEKVGPMVHDEAEWYTCSDGRLWNKEGERWIREEWINDLIAEWTEPETGTLAELDVKPGDVVEWFNTSVVNPMEVISASIITSGAFEGQVEAVLSGYGSGIFSVEQFRIISRASDTLMRCAECVCEKGGDDCNWIASYTDETFFGLSANRFTTEELQHIADHVAAELSKRIKPEPVRETVTGWWNGHNFHNKPNYGDRTHRITFTTTDGKPDLDSIKMEALG